MGMAIMRCRIHAPKGRNRSYVAAVEPVGYPTTALVCGAKSRNAAAFAFLEPEEKNAYDRGERVVQSFTDTMKVRPI
jgi:hypothetical protein